MKKFLLMLMLVVMCVSAASAEVKIGVLTKLNLTPEDFAKIVKAERESGKVKIFSLSGKQDDMTFVFYDSLNAMQMGLNAGDVNAIALPEDVGEYLLNVTEGYTISAIIRDEPVFLSLGFRKSDDPELRDKFNDALLSMKADGTLAIMLSKFVTEAGIGEPEPIKFYKYSNTDTVKVAITGDMPPIDYVGADGKPAGFNTAILAEICRRLHLNVELVQIDSGARAASLASGRSDIVFWFQSRKAQGKILADVPDGVVLSESYYNWDDTYLITKK
ncbi:MAG: transporter substrate-binding domain-containing protein [Synergistaceae bacterium]|nr:transporter substrate-binding domain-containing protein [Synergistaceae bacterium]